MADSPVQVDNRMPDDVAADLLTKYSKGVTRLHLTQLAIGSFNRDISPKYVHHRLQKILNVDGFTRFRY